jgi:aspartyl-tRNA synthetase
VGAQPRRPTRDEDARAPVVDDDRDGNGRGPARFEVLLSAVDVGKPLREGVAIEIDRCP